MTDRTKDYLGTFDEAAARLGPICPGPASEQHTTELVALGLKRGRTLRSAALRLAVSHLRRRLRASRHRSETTRITACSAQQVAAE